MSKIPSREEMRMLSSAEVLEVLSEEELQDLAERCPDVYLQQGETFSTSDDTGDGLFVLKEGRVQLYKLDPQGHQQTLIEVETGTALLAERLAGSYAQALQPTTMISISQEELRRLFQRNPEVALQLTKLLARRLRQADERLADIALKEVPARLASLIVQLIENEGIVTREGYRKISTHYTHERLATMIGARRVAVSRAFTTLQDAEILELRDRRILVKDMEALERTARG